jgi:hypothetical protein
MGGVAEQPTSYGGLALKMEPEIKQPPLNISYIPGNSSATIHNQQHPITELGPPSDHFA